jgi:kynureninase
MLDEIESAGIDAVRAKSVLLTEFALSLVEELIPDAEIASPREADRRGGHLTIDHPNSARAVQSLWAEGVIPDFRHPSGVRIGLSPLSTSFAEVERGIRALARALE